MKKLGVVLLGTFLVIGLLTGCGSSDKKDTATKTTQNKDTATKDTTNNQSSKEESKYPFPESATKTGNGSIVVNTPSGTSQNGNVPVLIVQADTSMTQIGLDLSNFDGSKQTYIYINKIFNSATQAGEMTQTSLDLDGNFLKPGTYTVNAVQFDNDDPKTGKVINFTTAQYQIKKGA